MFVLNRLLHGLTFLGGGWKANLDLAGQSVPSVPLSLPSVCVSLPNHSCHILVIFLGESRLFIVCSIKVSERFRNREKHVLLCSEFLFDFSALV